ncbi:NAD(P)-binding protein [Thozetella sp. PMI_491]|nr:NAD(P)-binding protein [Thozetella sp. PMI_491]
MESTASTQQKVVLITGATSGIGAELAKHLHKLDYNVGLAGRRTKEGHNVAAALDPASATAIFVQCDVSNYEEQVAMFRAVWDKWGRLDVVILNAGFADRDSKYILGRRGASIDDVPPQPDTTCLDVELKSVIHSTMLATHFMRHNPIPGGKIIITGSIVGVHILPTLPEHATAKAGVHHWARSVAPILKHKENISMNIVMPGPCDSSAMPGFADAFLPEHLTTPECLLSAYDVFFDDDANERSGQAIETAHDRLFFHELPEYKHGEVSKRPKKIYEPWFAWVHGEKSNLPDAIQGPWNGV